MIPLAVSGPIVIGSAFVIAVILLIVLFRLENRYRRQEEREAPAPGADEDSGEA